VREEIAIVKDEKPDRKRLVHAFTGDTFIGPPCTDGVLIKINKVSFDLEIEVTKRPAHSDRGSSWRNSTELNAFPLKRIRQLLPEGIIPVHSEPPSSPTDSRLP
jgi:hypothetical protein